MRGTGLWLLLGAAAALAGELPVVRVEKVVDDAAGGSFTRCAVGMVGGRKTFLKSNRGSMRGTRYANFESDILAKAIFDRLGLAAPDVRLVRLERTSPLARDLGAPVLAMEFVDTRFARGTVYHGGLPDQGQADLDEFLRMLAADLIMANGDRREANYFVIGRYGAAKGEKGVMRPVPIDNNCAFSTMVNWARPSSQVNFVESWDGVGTREVLKDLGTIRNLVQDSWTYPGLLADKRLRPRLRRIAGEVAAALDDGFFGEAVEALDRAVLPAALVVDPDEAWTRELGAAERALLFGEIRTPLKGAALFAARKAELKRRFAWRRDRLGEALEAYWAAADAAPPRK